jgi:hypothetical protein
MNWFQMRLPELRHRLAECAQNSIPSGLKIELELRRRQPSLQQGIRFRQALALANTWHKKRFGAHKGVKLLPCRHLLNLTHKSPGRFRLRTANHNRPEKFASHSF